MVEELVILVDKNDNPVGTEEKVKMSFAEWKITQSIYSIII